MKRYPIRVAKYAVYLIVLFFILFGAMRAFGSSTSLAVLWGEPSRGLMLLGAVVVFALLYPFFGFTKKRLTFNTMERVEDVDKVMAMCGFKRVVSSEPIANNHMVFEAATLSKRVLMLFEDKIEITTLDGISHMEGNRKEVVRAYFRMGTYIG